MLFLYRPRQTRIPVRMPRAPTQQRAYNQHLQQEFASASASHAPASPPRHEHAATLERALRAGLAHDTAAVAGLCTDDVKVWTPAMAVSSAQELAAELERRDDAFSDADLQVVPLDVNGDRACVEWLVTMTHTGPLSLADGQQLEPTGASVSLRGATVAEFRGDRIAGLRQYWDELGVLEQLGVLDP